MKPFYSALALAFATVFPFSACREKEPQPEALPAPAESGKTTELTPAHAVPDTFKAELGKVLDGYSRIQGALAKDDIDGAKEALSSMHGILHAMPGEVLDSAAASQWEGTEARVMAALHPMSTADFLGAFRTHYMDFSQVLLDAIGKFGVAGKEPLYHFHCPMARDNKGPDWVQKDSLLANPYFGSSMLKCGELVKIQKG